MAEPIDEDILSTSFDASLEEFDQNEKEQKKEEEQKEEEIKNENEIKSETENETSESDEDDSDEEIFEANLISEVSQVKDEMDKPLEKSDSCASLKRISFIEDNETKVYSEITDSTFALPQGNFCYFRNSSFNRFCLVDPDDNPVEVKKRYKHGMRSLLKFKSLRKFFGFVFSCARAP